MTIVIEYTVKCDGPGCSARLFTPGVDRLPTPFTQGLAERGWRSDGNFDYCAACLRKQEEGAAETPQPGHVQSYWTGEPFKKAGE